MHVPIPIGMPTLWRHGTLTAQGGLVFIAGTQDYYLRVRGRDLTVPEEIQCECFLRNLDSRHSHNERLWKWLDGARKC
jgi:hypothetical protein